MLSLMSGTFIANKVASEAILSIENPQTIAGTSMRLVSYRLGQNNFFGVRDGDRVTPIGPATDNAPLSDLPAAARRPTGPSLALSEVPLRPPLPRPGKIICVGLNYADHSAESGFEQPDYPTLFGRFSTTLIGHRAPMIRPNRSDQLDYEGEIAAVIGRRASMCRRRQRWTTSPATPSSTKALCASTSSSPRNGRSARISTAPAPSARLGHRRRIAAGGEGAEARDAPERRSRSDAPRPTTWSSVSPSLVAIISEAITLEPGDVIVTGTPAGVGGARKPPLFMKPGDVCEVEVEGIGLLPTPSSTKLYYPGASLHGNPPSSTRLLLTPSAGPVASVSRSSSTSRTRPGRTARRPASARWAMCSSRVTSIPMRIPGPALRSGARHPPRLLDIAGKHGIRTSVMVNGVICAARSPATRCAASA